VARYLSESTMRAPARPFRQHAPLALPNLPSVGALAHWLGLTVDELETYTSRSRWRYRAGTRLLAAGSAPDIRSPAQAASPASHYHLKIMPKRDGSPRLLEAPKSILKTLQRRVHQGLLAGLPCNPCAHGFVAHRGPSTFTVTHVAQPVVLRFDLANFFTSIPAPRVHGLFRTLGYPAGVSRALTQLCTHAVRNPRMLTQLPPQMRASARMPHLPQGAPSSPTLANLAAYRLDLRCHGFAQSLGAQYTRYADDLAFSGGSELARKWRLVERTVHSIAREEGFSLNPQKTRKMKQGVRQALTGLVLNHRATPPRKAIKTLEAVLVNCVRHGPTSQNRDSLADFRGHLIGRVSYMAQFPSTRTAKLTALLAHIDWAR
jgi:RNA-directed DNA polymerase